MVIVLDLGAFNDLEADAGKQAGYAAQRQRNRMQPPGLLATTGQSHVNGLAGQPLFKLAGFQRNPARFQRSGKGVPGLVDPGARRLARFGREQTQGLHLFGDEPFLAKIANPDLIQQNQRIGFGKLPLCVRQNVFKGSHGQPGREMR